LKLAPEGNIIIYPLSFCWVVCIIFSSVYNSDGLYIFLTVLSILLIFCINFFRDPNRIIPKQENYVLSPADGKIIKIIEFDDPETGEKFKMASIFLSVFNVHINRMPIKGKFINVNYVKGEFLAAFDHEASDKNERMEIDIESKFGIIKVKQIAGLIARRILCYAKEGDKMPVGGRLGFIRFGSRTDIILPASINLDIKLNQKVIGGETIIGVYE
jgi:phosphatidylserine decarboxylase